MGRALVGAIGSALLYIADFMCLEEHLKLLDRDHIELSDLNRSPLSTIGHGIDHEEKTVAARLPLLPNRSRCAPSPERGTSMAHAWRRSLSTCGSA